MGVGRGSLSIRAHPKRSMQANANTRARTAWYDPSAARKWIILPDWEQMVWELLQSAHRSSLPWAERTRCCLAIVGTHYWRRFKDAGGLVKRRLTAHLSRKGLARQPAQLAARSS